MCACTQVKIELYCTTYTKIQYKMNVKVRKHWAVTYGLHVTPYAISLCHVLILPSLLPYLYDQTALPQSTGLTLAVAAISILSSLFP
jgi:hypothetical protein